MQSITYLLKSVFSGMALLVFAMVVLPVSVQAESMSGSASAQSSMAPPVFPKFEILRFEAVGNTLFETAAIDHLLAPFAGKGRDFGDIQKALETLQHAYVAAGYGTVLVKLPEQDVEHGVVRFTVIEGKIKQISVSGNSFHDEANVRASVPMVQVGSAPRAARIESNLKAANDNPSKKTQVVLRSTDQPGEIDATLQVVDEKTWKVGVTLDNTGMPQTGNNRVGVFFQNYNVGNRDQVFSMQYTTSPSHPGDVKVFGAAYHIPLYSLGDSLDFFAGHADVNGSVQSFVFSGGGNVYGARYNHNLSRHGDYDHKLSFGIDQRDYKNFTLGTAVLSSDVTVRPLSLSYSGNWLASKQLLSLYVTEVANLKGAAKGGAADFAAVRTNANTDYLLTRYGVDYSRSFAGDWQARVNVDGQYTSDALVPGEQFGIGGTTSVRGFYEREIANDSGYRSSVELYTPEFAGARKSKMRVLAFYDFGEVNRNKSLPGEVTRSGISSAGVGARASMGNNFLLQAYLAKVFDDGGTRTSGQTRLHFSMALTY